MSAFKAASKTVPVSDTVPQGDEIPPATPSPPASAVQGMGWFTSGTSSSTASGPSSQADPPEAGLPASKGAPEVPGGPATRVVQDGGGKPIEQYKPLDHSMSLPPMGLINIRDALKRPTAEARGVFEPEVLPDIPEVPPGESHGAHVG